LFETVQLVADLIAWLDRTASSLTPAR